MSAVKAYVVFCHPTHDSLAGAALQRVLRGLAAGGHEVRVSDLYADGFTPEFSRRDREIHRLDHREHPELRADLATYVDNLRWCDALVFVHPTWWSGQPAMLKGWIDRVWVNGVAWELPEGSARIRPLLRNIRRIVVVTTHGSPKYVNAVEGEGGKRIVTRSLRATCGLRCRTSWIALYGVDRDSLARRRRFLDRVERRLARL